MDTDAIMNIIESFLIKHKINLDDVDFGEYIWQDNSTRFDAIDFAIDILNACKP